MTDPISFRVVGVPAPGGSKKSFHIRYGNGRFVTNAKGDPIIRTADDAGKGNAIWRRTVSVEARRIFARPLPDVALSVEFWFFVKRPKSHYRGQDVQRGLRPDAPKFPKFKPDALKFGRSTEDALTGIAWADDAANVDVICRKRYADEGWTGCEITITPLEDAAPQRERAKSLFETVK
jgi:Holliday junction resolvase RusA-like endonuclease